MDMRASQALQESIFTSSRGKDERGVGYLKNNALAGHGFARMEALEQHLVWVRAR